MTAAEGKDSAPATPDGSTIHVSLHGPGVTVDAAIEAAVATKELLEEIGRTMGHDLKWEVASIQFKCDGCGLTRPDRPRPDEGWTYRDGDDLCPSCSVENADA